MAHWFGDSRRGVRALLATSVALAVCVSLEAQPRRRERPRLPRNRPSAPGRTGDAAPLAGWNPSSPFEGGEFKPVNEIDKLVLAGLKKAKLQPAKLCSDAVFIRRVHLDMIGTLPDPRRVREFLQDRRADKRARLIEELFQRPEFAQYWTQRWGDVLRIKAEFPINLWPNGVQAYSRWALDAIRTNMPYDQFARELLTSSGSNFRVPQVNFYRALQGTEPRSIATAVSLTFMGARFDSWPAASRAGFEAMFSRVAYKKTSEWKEEIVYLDPTATTPLDTVLPDGTKVHVPAGKDPRVVFANWLITPTNPWFTRNIVNRIWAWLLGRGIIHEPDDIRASNPAVNPELLDYLARELVRAKYDMRHIFRMILNSSTYQQSPIPRGDGAKAERLFACYGVRRLDAEVLIDALDGIAGSNENYSSVIPEPYTFIPPDQRTIELEDGSITSGFLEMFGRPSRDTGMHSERSNKPSEAQRLHFLNSSTVQRKISNSWRLRTIQNMARGNTGRTVDIIYMTTLSRPPTPAERKAASAYFNGKSIGTRNGAIDLVWALINTKEFQYRH